MNLFARILAAFAIAYGMAYVAACCTLSQSTAQKIIITR